MQVVIESGDNEKGKAGATESSPISPEYFMPDGIIQTGDFVKKDVISRTATAKTKFNNIANLFMRENDT